ncbi:hypothetical protein FRC01_001400 [Tulasnella sp. 417]|nr:hypothetical protein FRC01_001400 [Tulasnella sp. 417]
MHSNTITPWERPHSATHAALVVGELQELIFPQLLAFEHDGRPYKVQKDLTNLAVTCRAFLEVALNIRWRNISFGQLIQVWEARGVLVQADMSWGGREMEFARTPTYEDWQRFEYYARRIRCMRLESLPATTQFSSAFANAVSNGSRQSRFQVKESPVLPIFPRLKSLEWKFGPGTSEVRVVTAVISESPALDSLAIFASPERDELPSDSWVAFFSSLDNHGRPLKSLKILARIHGSGASYDMEAKIPSLVQLIRRSALQELILPSDAIGAEAIAIAISYIPTLKVLEVSDQYSVFEVYEAAPVPHNAFSSLECLRGDVITVVSLLIIPTFPSLAKLMIQGPSGEANVAWPFIRRAIGAIGQNCPALEVLHLRVGLFFKDFEDVGGSETGRTGPTSAFASLRGCPRLKDVLFDLSGTWFDGFHRDEINLLDEQWEHIAEAWPDLTSVWFGTGVSYEGHGLASSVPRPRATLRTIASFFRHCPKLSSFGVAISARGEEARSALGEISPKQGPTRLDLRGSWIIEDAQDVAIFLASQLPHQDSEIQIPQSQLEYNRGTPEQALEVARREDLQRIRQLVGSARTTRHTLGL